jgi:hypothetical protein
MRLIRNPPLPKRRSPRSPSYPAGDLVGGSADLRSIPRPIATNCRSADMEAFSLRFRRRHGEGAVSANGGVSCGRPDGRRYWSASSWPLAWHTGSSASVSRRVRRPQQPRADLPRAQSRRRQWCHRRHNPRRHQPHRPRLQVQPHRRRRPCLRPRRQRPRPNQRHRRWRRRRPRCRPKRACPPPIAGRSRRRCAGWITTEAGRTAYSGPGRAPRSAAFSRRSAARRQGGSRRMRPTFWCPSRECHRA